MIFILNTTKDDDITLANNNNNNKTKNKYNYSYIKFKNNYLTTNGSLEKKHFKITKLK